jgi:hypothetical protein
VQLSGCCCIVKGQSCGRGDHLGIPTGTLFQPSLKNKLFGIATHLSVCQRIA